jgi:four helix bundle protein
MTEPKDTSSEPKDTSSEPKDKRPGANNPLLPHHKLVAYRVAVELLAAVKDAKIRDASLRDQALRAAKSACLNCAEGAGRVTRPDKARAFAIARGEAVEAVAAVEIAAVTGDASDLAAKRCVVVASRLVGLLTGLTR